MPSLKISSLFSDIFIVLLPLFLILYFKCLWLIPFSIVFFLWRTSYKEAIVLLCLLALVLLRLLLVLVDTSYYYVKEIKTNSYVLSNILYDVEVYTNEELAIDDIVKVTEKELTSEDDFYDGIFYESEEIEKVLDGFTLRHYLWGKVEELEESTYKTFIEQTIFDYNDYDTSFFTSFSINLSLYYCFRCFCKVLRKSKKREVIAGLILFLVFGLSYSLIRVLIFEFFKKKCKERSKSFALSVITLILVEPYAIYSYRFLIPVIIRGALLIKSELDFRVVITLVQSYFFYEVAPLLILLYRPMMSLLVVVNLLAVIGLIINPLSFIGELAFNIFYALDTALSISFRGQISIFFIIFYYLFIKAFRIRLGFLKWAVAMLFVASNISNIFASVTFIDVGQGDAILIREAFNGASVLIDTGSPYNYYKLDRYLKRKGIYTIDVLVITHGDNDHSGNLLDLVADYDVKEIVYEHEDVSTGSIYLYSLNSAGYGNSNDDSLVYYLDFGGLSFLFTGDISQNVEIDIVSAYPTLEVDILKLSHHGSKTGTSEDLLLNYDVKLAIASTNGSYGHPSSDVTDRLDKWQILYLVTKDSGDIVFTFYSFGRIAKWGSGEFVIIRGWTTSMKEMRPYSSENM